MEEEIEKGDHHNKVGSNDRASIAVLTDDCLVEIFKYLPICDRIRIQRVNKHWRALSQASWSSFKRLDFSKELWGLSGDKLICNAALTTVLTQCGKYLTDFYMYHEVVDREVSNAEIDEGVKNGMSDEDWDNPKEVPLMNFDLFKLCPNLKSIDFTNKSFTAENMRIFIKHCKNIEKIGFNKLFKADWLPHMWDIDIDQVIQATALKTYKNLRSVKFFKCDITDKCLKSLSTEFIEELEFSYCMGLSFSAVQNIISKCQKLKRLSLKAFTILFELPELMYPESLQHLDISHNCDTVNDERLKCLIKSAKSISSLNISENRDVTDKGLAYVALLPNLEHLYIHNMGALTGKTLTNMPRLKTLSCEGSFRIRKKYLEQILEVSDQLQLLDLTELYQFSETFVMTVVEYLNKRQNDVTLKLILSTIDEDHPVQLPKKLPPNLKLILKD